MQFLSCSVDCDNNDTFSHVTHIVPIDIYGYTGIVLPDIHF